MYTIQKILVAASFAALAMGQASQISDGQLQASTRATAVTSTSTTARAVSQITDGQIQAPTRISTTSTSTVAPLSQFTDGQIRGPTAVSSGAPKPSTNGTGVVAPSPSPFRGAGNALAWSKGVAGAAVVVIGGLVML
ncbi:MAG: hypothetical protein Q9191_008004 [Dirinaria sp. TL-2023a]